MSWLDKLNAVSSQVSNLFAKPEQSAGDNATGIKKTEQTGFWNWLGGAPKTTTPGFNQNGGLNFTAQKINLSNEDIKAQTSREATRLYSNQSQLGGRVQAAVINRQTPVAAGYEGGTLSVVIKPTDSQSSFVHRGLHDHAVKAGLSETEANEFADAWITKNSSYNNRADGKNTPYTAAEFKDLKTKGTASFDLTKQYDAPILADLNERVGELAMTVDSMAFTAPQTTSQVTLDAGKIKNGDDALVQYIQNTYNPERSVWGDKILEMADAAKQQGVKVDNFELTTDENGKETAKFSVSGANKQKLDDLFGDALSQTIKGEQGNDEGQREGTRMLADQGRVLWNSGVNIVEGTINGAIDLAMSKGGQDPLYLTQPEIVKPHVDFSGAKSKYESELMRRNVDGVIDGDGIKAGDAIEVGVTVVAPIVVGAAIKPTVAPNTLETLGALPETETVATTSQVSKTISQNSTLQKPVVETTLESQPVNETSRVYRVQGGTPPRASKFRIMIGKMGNMVVKDKEKEALFVTFDDVGRVKIYQAKNRPGSEIISFEVDPKFVQQVREAAVYEKDARSFPNAPIIADPTKTNGSFGLPPEWTEKLINAAKSGTGKIDK